MYNHEEIIKKQQEQRNHILKGFMTESKDSLQWTEEQFNKAKTELNLEVYTEDSLNQFKVNLRKASAHGNISPEELQKVESDLSKLVKIDIIEKGIGTGLMKKFITDKNGKKMTVWVKPAETHNISDHKDKVIEGNKPDNIKETISKWDMKELTNWKKELEDTKKDYEDGAEKIPSNLKIKIDIVNEVIKEKESNTTPEKKEQTKEEKDKERKRQETIEKIKDPSKREGLSKK